MPALAVALATLAGCALPEARAPFVDPVSSLIEEWHQEDLANDRGMRFISLVGVYRGATAGDGQLHRIATRILEANAPLCGERIFRHFGLRFAEQSGHAIALLAGAAAEAGLHGDDPGVAMTPLALSQRLSQKRSSPPRFAHSLPSSSTAAPRSKSQPTRIFHMRSD